MRLYRFVDIRFSILSDLFAIENDSTSKLNKEVGLFEVGSAWRNKLFSCRMMRKSVLR